MLQILDCDGKRLLRYEDLRDGFFRLRVVPAIRLTDDDFESLTEVMQKC
jgi:hypothetical protein